MNFHFFSDFESMSTEGFELIKKEIEKKPNLLFCVASGGSPAGAGDCGEAGQGGLPADQLRQVRARRAREGRRAQCLRPARGRGGHVQGAAR